MVIRAVLMLVLCAFSINTWAQSLLSVSTQSEVSLQDMVDTIEPGTVVILGESHSSQGGPHEDQLQQVKMIQALQQKFNNVHVGMEFINYTHQVSVDEYLNGELTDDEFKQAVGWGSNPFKDYKQQILLPVVSDGWTHALNAPRTLTRSIARNGLDNLTDEELALMPPHFELGSDIYKARFYEAIGASHGDDSEFLTNMFAAQCTWDDTMAWKTIEAFNNDPSLVMVIIVGNFHARYNGGLPDRLMARGHQKIVTVIQTANEGLSDTEVLELSEPHPDYGVISDYIW